MLRAAARKHFQVGDVVIEMEDLTHEVPDPCLMDVKMGNRTYTRTEYESQQEAREDLYDKMMKHELEEKLRKAEKQRAASPPPPQQRPGAAAPPRERPPIGGNARSQAPPSRGASARPGGGTPKGGGTPSGRQRTPAGRSKAMV